MKKFHWEFSRWNVELFKRCLNLQTASDRKAFRSQLQTCGVSAGTKEQAEHLNSSGKRAQHGSDHFLLFRHVRRETCLQSSHKEAKKSAQLQVYEHFSLLALWSVVGFTWRDVDEEDNRIIFKPWNRKSDKFLHTRVTGVQWSSCCFVQFLGRRNHAGRMLFVSVLISIDIFV